jgi:translation initiation factor 1A
MVKNTTGGKKGKSVGRKSFTTTKTMLSTSPLEVYGIVTKMMGGKICEVKCQDDVVRLCHIRGAFSGKNKGSNFIRSGHWVLVGLRDWATEKQHCDLLFLYTDREKEKILQMGALDVLQREEHRINQTDPSDMVIADVDFEDGEVEFENI